MCGITGIVSFSGPRAFVPIIHKMTDAIAHRGPDDEGYTVISQAFAPKFFSGRASPPEVSRAFSTIESAYGIPGEIALGHRRFSIIDPTPDGHQPWYDKERGTVLVFNGEIYNYIELREELEKLGFSPFRSHTDTEILALAYRAWGTECFKRFNGFWAVAIADLKKRRLILSRDRFGKKPLYLHWQDRKTLIFSSEMRSLMCGTPGGRRSFSVDNGAALLYLLYDRRNTLKGSMWKEIELLPAGVTRTVELDSGSYADDQYWSFPRERRTEADISLPEAAQGFRELFENAVRLRLRSDVPLTANLSGGMDSSSIVVTAQHIMGKRATLMTDHVRYRDANALDEYEYARAVAKKAGCDYRELYISYDEMFSELDHLVELLEEPVHSMAFLTQWLQWRVIASSGTRVALHGTAGDELLCGYSHLCDLVNFESLAKLNLRKYFAVQPFKNFRKHLQAMKWILKGKAALPQITTNPLRTLFGLPEPEHNTYYFSKRFLDSTDDVHQEFNHLYLEANSSIENRIRAEFELLRIPFWCNAMDKSMMSIPLEVRMPFLDYRLVEFTSQLPIEYLYSAGWTKLVLREAVKELLPDAVVWRKGKIGFSAPFKKWLVQLKPEATALLKKEEEKLSAFINVHTVLDKYDNMPILMLWRIINFAKWLDIFKPMVNK